MVMQASAERSRKVGKGPDFLVIGAQRAGTTWLHRVLRQHPSLWLAPVKELHYFDKLDTVRTCLDPKERRRLGFGRLWLLDSWAVHFWLGRRHDAWYARLFEDARRRGLISGEITPAYAILGEDIFRRIKSMNRDVKLIFIMRDPLERAWSAVNNALRKGQVDGAFNVEKAIARARSSGTAARSAYTKTIQTLEEVFQRSQLHYCFFDDLRDRPETLVTEIVSFLGATPGKVRSYLPAEAVNSAAGAKPAPIEFQRELAKDYLPMVIELCQRFDEPPHKWRVRYEALLKRQPSLSVSAERA
jgi:Sulfotransferase domain